MIVTLERTGDFIPDEVSNDIVAIVTDTLNGIKTTDTEFIINDKLCFKTQTNGKVTPCVTNSATFISSKFQSLLSEKNGCKGETKINGQSFDGFIQRSYNHVGYKIIDRNNLLEVIFSYIAENKLKDAMVHTLFPKFYGMYVERGCFNISNLPISTHCLFQEEIVTSHFRVGVEFETGNVASSFRAINKLGILYQQGFIDAGVFVTSASRPRIWPTSNRNGSFPELINRDYENQISLPLICIGFSPDKYDQSAPFLSRSGDTYNLVSLNKMDPTGIYRVYQGQNNEEILIPE
ncbi:hypothetical protein PUND_a3122 [Pseudoalteromonas undina]|uniref:Uncharacterized protein n=1 Tax=Pseudoalteromonas undina TaxID=43660 RepID=A0ABP2XVK4_9GAMM|nr:hypothetical protein [Pseudoalteromonas undina]KAF7767193.1 hypothetical protein PUND_a3122 [Pseudoalteromonas undina]